MEIGDLLARTEGAFVGAQNLQYFRLQLHRCREDLVKQSLKGKILKERGC